MIRDYEKEPENWDEIYERYKRVSEGRYTLNFFDFVKSSYKAPVRNVILKKKDIDYRDENMFLDIQPQDDFYKY